MTRTLLASAPLALALLLTGCTSTGPAAAPSDAMKASSPAMMEPSGAMSSGAMSPSSAMAGGAMSTDAMAAHGSYVTFADYSSSMAKYSGTSVVYFFHASWCPDCKASDMALSADMSKIPAKVTIVKVDYDTATELKMKYGVTMQHTFVQVDANGALVKKWSGTTVDMILAGIKA